MKLDIFGKRLIVRSPLKVYNNPTLGAIGITNHTKDNYFMPFFDYDNVAWKVVQDDIEFFQKNYDIGTVEVRQSSNFKAYGLGEIGKYHVIGFTKFTFPEMLNLISLSRCDPKYKKREMYPDRVWVLRLGWKVDLKSGMPTKPATKHLKLIEAPTDRQASLGAINYVQLLNKKVYGAKSIVLREKFKSVDDINHIERIEYVTR